MALSNVLCFAYITKHMCAKSRNIFLTFNVVVIAVHNCLLENSCDRFRSHSEMKLNSSSSKFLSDSKTFIE